MEEEKAGEEKESREWPSPGVRSMANGVEKTGRFCLLIIP